MNDEEIQIRKKAIFDTMSRKGQERILRMGYDNWDPFMEPKDPRERIFGTTAQKAIELLREFYATRNLADESVAQQKELFDLCRGLLQDERRAKIVFDFCLWFREKTGLNP